MEQARIRARTNRSLVQSRATLAVLVLFWAFHFGSLTAQRLLMAGDDTVAFLLPRLAATAAGIVISLGIARHVAGMAGRPWRRRLAMTLLLALAGATLHSACNFVIFQIAMREENWRQATVASYASAWIQWVWSYACISCILLIQAYAAELRTRDNDLKELRGLADAAQLTALRYQLNPHFMFNTLNSIVSLIGAGRGIDAETMVEDLSDYYRAMLAVELGDEVALSREVDMQRLYLGIESVRFAERIEVGIDLPPELDNVPVPSLILQPLVENAVKHGVARRDVTTAVRIRAQQQGKNARISVCNDLSGCSREQSPGAGIGLANVSRRLQLFYGTDCDFRAASDPARDMFEVSFVVPRERP